MMAFPTPVCYYKMLDETDALGRVNFVNTGGVTFNSTGPVSGEGQAVISGGQNLNTGASAILQNLGANVDFLFYCWCNFPGSPNINSNPFCNEMGNTGFDLSFKGIPSSNILGIDWETPCSDGSFASEITHSFSPFVAGQHCFIGWWDEALQTMFAQVDGGTVLSKVAGVGGGPPDVTNFLELTAGPPIGPIGCWSGTIPDSSQRSLLFAATPYNILFPNTAVPSWPNDASGFLAAVHDKWLEVPRYVG